MGAAVGRANSSVGFLHLSPETCRVDPDNYLSEPPTDPDMRDYRIRLLELRIRYAATYRVDGNWWRKGVTL
jgi:hypothetical protein